MVGKGKGRHFAHSGEEALRMPNLLVYFPNAIRHPIWLIIQVLSIMTCDALTLWRSSGINSE